MRFQLPPSWVALTLICLAAPVTAAADGIPTYLALGDSLAFGFTDSTTPSYGDRGYVGDYANYLATTTGNRPYVINLATYNETTSTFLNGGNSYATMNQNYTDTTTSQNSMMLSTIANAQKSGDPINTVSVQLGANDLFAATATPGFFSMTAAQQTGLVEQAIETAATNVAGILKEIKADLPNANVLVMGYYNPYAAVPSNPLSAVAAPAVQGLDAALKADADAFGDRYVDTYTPFLGNEAQYTFIASSGTQYNVHPNDQGYQVIANQMEVPEPSTLMVLGAGVAGLLATRRRFGQLTSARS